MRYRLTLAKWIVIRELGQPSPRILSNPAAAAELAKDLVQACDDDKEHFWVILLNPKNRYLMHTLVSTGTQTASLVHPREVFGPAVREGASSILLVHNHPSGDPQPLKEDVRLTRELLAAAKILNITLQDHLVVGNGTLQWVSFRQRGLM